MSPFAPPFLLGANLPWSAVHEGGTVRSRCGWDFGPSPPEYGPAGAGAARSWSETRADFARLRALGVRDVRFFVLAHGVNYPVGEPVERYGAICARGPVEVLDPDSRAAPPRLPPEFLRDFDALLGACEEAGVRLWPSLLSFELVGPLRRQGAGTTSGGRAGLVFGEKGRERSIERFLESTLDPLLALARARPSAVGAFEVMNEPDWAVSRGVFRRRGGLVPPSWMGRLLSIAVRRIAESGLVATVGFADADPSWLPRRDRRELERLAARGVYVHQLHHYPGEHRPRSLPAHRDLPIRPCLVGEMPTALGTFGPSPNMRWEDPGLAEADPGRFLVERLELVRRLGYPGAFVWALHARDGATSWAEGQAEQIRAFAARL